MMKKVFLIVNCLVVCGLFVGAALLLTKQGFLEDVLMALAPAKVNWERPSDAPDSMTIVKGEEGKSVSVPFESMQDFRLEWVSYAIGIETQLGFAQTALKQQAANVRNARVLFWIAFILLVVNVGASLRAFLKESLDRTLATATKDT